MRLEGALCGKGWETSESSGWMLNTWHLVPPSGTQNKMVFHSGGCISMRFLMRSWIWLFVVFLPPKSISGDVISQVRNNNLRACWLHFIPENIGDLPSEISLSISVIKLSCLFPFSFFLIFKLFSSKLSPAWLVALMRLWPPVLSSHPKETALFGSHSALGHLRGVSQARYPYTLIS